MIEPLRELLVNPAASENSRHEDPELAVMARCAGFNARTGAGGRILPIFRYVFPRFLAETMYADW